MTVVDKCRELAIQIVNLCKYLTDEKKEYVMSKQLLKSGTSIGANVVEAYNSQSKKEYIAKMNIALKEAAESEYWLKILNETNYLTNDEYKSINNDCVSINKLLITIIKNTKKKYNL